MVGPAFARHARTEARLKRGGETIFSLRGPPAGRSWRRRGRASWRRLAKRFRVACSDQAAAIERVSRSAFVTIWLSMAHSRPLARASPIVD